MSKVVRAVQVGKTDGGEPLVVATEARVIALEKAMDEAVEHIKAIEKIIRQNAERELMFIAELAKDDPEYGAYMEELKDRVASYPIDHET